MADALDLKSNSQFGSEGSTPSFRIGFIMKNSDLIHKIKNFFTKKLNTIEWCDVRVNDPLLYSKYYKGILNEKEVARVYRSKSAKKAKVHSYN
jgi:hypothetical protein